MFACFTKKNKKLVYKEKENTFIKNKKLELNQYNSETLSSLIRDNDEKLRPMLEFELHDGERSRNRIDELLQINLIAKQILFSRQNINKK